MATIELVAAPARSPRRGGIRDIATFVSNARLGATETVAFISKGCTFPQTAPGLCYGEQTSNLKAGVGVDTINGIGAPFAQYAGVECFISADSSADYSQRALGLLHEGEYRGLESRLAAWAEAGTSIGASTDIVEAIAGLENRMDQDYPGQGVIILNRGDAVRASAAGAIWGWTGVDTVPTTVNGTPVLATSSATWTTASAVGAITVLRSETNTFPGMDHTTNMDWQIAEAVYAILVDCEYRIQTAIG